MTCSAGDEARQRLAVEDFDDLKAADIVLAYAEPPRQMSNQCGGRHVEFGMALALGKPIFVVGAKENVFHYLPGVRHFGDTVEAAHAITALPDK